MKGYFNKVLIVDVTNRSSLIDDLDDATLTRHLGGKGLATHLLVEKNPAGVDPLAPENHLIFALGPASDSPIWGSCRHGMFSKSPLTGCYGESYSGGHLAIPMSRTGYDAIAITGASSTPVWLEVSDRGVTFHDASDLWGKETYETEDDLMRRVGVRDAGCTVIGPAGENLIRFAVVENDYWRSSGRTGMGAVLGSKKIKGIVFHGTQSRPHADPDGIKAFARELRGKYKDHAATQNYFKYGTPVMVALLNNAGGFPTRYWSQGTFDRWPEISGDALIDRYHPQSRACRNCFMACGKYIEIKEGRHKGLKIEGPEYETIYAFGGLCLIDKLDEIAYLNDICDRLGMDTITAGNMVAFAIEASKRGKIPETLDYGDPDAAAMLLTKISRREGTGDLLADGIKTASAALRLDDLAVHVKGMEPAGYDPRALKGMGLAYAVSDRGACHLRATFYKAELAGMVDPKNISTMPEVFIDFEDRCTLHDCLIVCRFYRDFYLWDELAKIINLTIGLTLHKEDLQRVAAQVVDEARRFNLREGLSAQDDRLPVRLTTDKLEDDRGITPGDVTTLVHEYYRLRGWNSEGIPLAGTEE